MAKAFVFLKHANPLRGHASERRDRDEDFKSLAMVGGFSVSGLALACIASKLMVNGGVSGLTLLLVLCLMPMAMALGFALESSER